MQGPGSRWQFSVGGLGPAIVWCSSSDTYGTQTTVVGPADMNLGLPLYLVVSDRLEVKVYRMNAAGEWGEEILWEGQPE